MRTRAWAALAAASLAALAAAQEPGKSWTWDFQRDRAGEAPAGFTFARTGSGRPGTWVVRVDPGAPAGDHVLAQVDGADEDRFAIAVADGPSLKDLRLEVRCKPLSGRSDQACGLVFRYRDADDYYVARANALEDNVRLYHVVKGRRSELAGWNGKVATGAWHALAVEARGDRLAVFFDGAKVIEAEDGTFRDAGKVGVWTKADSVTEFDALAVKPLP